MMGPSTWTDTAETARAAQAAGLSGMLFTEMATTPWMSLAVAATAAPELELSTGIAVAFPRSPMISAGTAWELAANTRGRFRVGLGPPHRPAPGAPGRGPHAAPPSAPPPAPPAPRLRDSLRAVPPCLAAFAGAELNHEGE